MKILHKLIVCIKCYASKLCPFILYYTSYKITVMIECITMNWDQCRNIKYDTLPQNSIQWKCEIIDHLQKLLWTCHPPYCYNTREWLPKNQTNNMIFCTGKWILSYDEQVCVLFAISSDDGLLCPLYYRWPCIALLT
jgi:hypothetical protein